MHQQIALLAQQSYYFLIMMKHRLLNNQIKGNAKVSPDGAIAVHIENLEQIKKDATCNVTQVEDTGEDMKPDEEPSDYGKRFRLSIQRLLNKAAAIFEEHVDALARLGEQPFVFVDYQAAPVWVPDCNSKQMIED
jgi:hypothetical protein